MGEIAEPNLGLGMSERLSRDVEMQNMGSTASDYADTEPIGQENPDEGVEGPGMSRLRAPGRML